MANHPFAAHLRTENSVSAHAISQNVFSVNVPDPEPGWATRHPERALAFLYVSPRPCSALEELMRL